MLIIPRISVNKVFNTILVKYAEIVKSAACHYKFINILYAMKRSLLNRPFMWPIPFLQFAYMKKQFYWIFSVCPLNIHNPWMGLLAMFSMGKQSPLKDVYHVECSLLFKLSHKVQSFVILWRHGHNPASHSEYLSPSGYPQLQPLM